VTALPAGAGTAAGCGVYAALDLGTNKLAGLLIACPTGERLFASSIRFSRIIRLGEGISATGRISDGRDRARRLPR